MPGSHQPKQYATHILQFGRKFSVGDKNRQWFIATLALWKDKGLVSRPILYCCQVMTVTQ